LMPVSSSGQWAGQAPDLYTALGSVDIMHLAGGGIIGHPDGIAAGMTSMREGWEAAAAGIDLDIYAQTHPALKRAMVHFSGR
jgi:ribulose-bisphosphate carboxylase large chain